MRWVKVIAKRGNESRVMWVSPRQIISVMEPIVPGMPGGIVIEGGGIFDVEASDLPQLLNSIALAEE